MAQFNNFFVGGRLTKEPAQYENVVAIDIAVNRGFGEKASVDFFRMLVHGKLGESVVAHYHKGHAIGVVGHFASGKEGLTLMVDSTEPNVANNNFAIVMGRLTKDPEIRTSKANTEFTVFSVANNRKYLDKAGEFKEVVTFVDVIVPGKSGEFAAKNLKKGDGVVCTGRMTAKQYKNKEGLSRTSYSLMASSCNFGFTKKNDANTASSASAPTDSGTQYSVPDTGDFVMFDDVDDLPF